MIAVLKGDIVDSRSVADASIWLKPLKVVLNRYGKSPKAWELAWGDAFQLQLAKPALALQAALELQACIRQLPAGIGLRLSIGIGERSYSAARVSESNGTAFINAGECFAQQKTILAIKSPWPELDETLNLMLRLANLQISNWSQAAAELMSIVLKNPNLNQTKIGTKLGIDQSSVSGRWQRASAAEVLELKAYFEQEINRHLA